MKGNEIQANLYCFLMFVYFEVLPTNQSKFFFRKFVRNFPIFWWVEQLIRWVGSSELFSAS